MTSESYRVEPRTGLHYLGRGDAAAPLVVLLHGFPDIPEAWLPVMERLAAAGYRAVAPAMPGYRPSPAPPAYDIRTLAKTVVAFGASLQEAPFVLVGHDWGAAITHDAVTHGPLAAAVTLSVPHPLTFLRSLATDPAQLHRSRYMAFFQLRGLPERALRRGFVRELWARWSPGRPPARHVEAVEARIRASLPGPLAYYRAMFRPLGLFLRRAVAMRPSAVPLLHLHGQHDRCIAPGATRGQERHFRGPHETRFLDGGHFLPTEVPEQVADAVIEWAGRHGAPVAQTPTSGS